MDRYTFLDGPDAVSTLPFSKGQNKVAVASAEVVAPIPWRRLIDWRLHITTSYFPHVQKVEVPGVRAGDEDMRRMATENRGHRRLWSWSSNSDKRPLICVKGGSPSLSFGWILVKYLRLGTSLLEKTSVFDVAGFISSRTARLEPTVNVVPTPKDGPWEIASTEDRGGNDYGDLGQLG
ncbi:hypothetical protein FA13DRAFT_1709643 [Coprinellus micaceus]|uniref:Uncharacterized protein n=1 Tax=Coprinellus micaceus TaxID=71717 RepID=A0A4Y7TC74_COPMI|nr:hypothetical protein FA13DRAFT_1709643 [Coprinellus micaceus]